MYKEASHPDKYKQAKQKKVAKNSPFFTRFFVVIFYTQVLRISAYSLK